MQPGTGHGQSQSLTRNRASEQGQRPWTTDVRKQLIFPWLLHWGHFLYVSSTHTQPRGALPTARPAFQVFLSLHKGPQASGSLRAGGDGRSLLGALLHPGTCWLFLQGQM